jgi:hypothetical protein
VSRDSHKGTPPGRGQGGIATITAFAVLAGGLMLAGAAGGQGAGSGEPAKSGGRTVNTCRTDEGQRNLKCPDLRMRPPFALDREKVGGRPVLRAANSIDSVGEGPAELVGNRSGPRTMKAKQKIYRRGGGRIWRKTGAELYFKSIPGQGRYWKFKRAATFRLYQLNRNGRRVDLVEVGPKQVYCLRDLQHTRPGMDGSPGHRVYPSCSQNASKQQEQIGTSVGWSDVYPNTYHENYIELNDIKKSACHAFVHIADPDNGIFEYNENNNQASTVVFLTKRGRWKPGECRGVDDEVLRANQTKDDTQVSKNNPPVWGGYY